MSLKLRSASCKANLDGVCLIVVRQLEPDAGPIGPPLTRHLIEPEHSFDVLGELDPLVAAVNDRPAGFCNDEVSANY